MTALVPAEDPEPRQGRQLGWLPILRQQEIGHNFGSGSPFARLEEPPHNITCDLKQGG